MGFLRWLFHREIARDEAIRLATQFAQSSWDEYTADWPGYIVFPYDFVEAVPGGDYWYVRFTRRFPNGGGWKSDRFTEVRVHKKTGKVDYGDRIGQRYFE